MRRNTSVQQKPLMVRGAQVLKLLLKQITEKTLVIEKIQEGSKSRVKENTHLIQLDGQ